MENDDWADCDCPPVLIPVSLIKSLTEAMLEVIGDWHDERGIDQPDVNRCFVAMVASVEAAMETLAGEDAGVTIQ